MSPPAEPSLRETAVRSVGWAAAEKWGARLAQLVTIAVLARFLEPREFGLVALAVSITAFATLVADQGFSKALVQRETIEDRHVHAAFWTTVGLAAAMALVVAALATPLGELLGEPRVADLIPFLALALPLTAIGATPAALMERTFRFRTLAVRRLAGETTGGAAAIVCAVSGAGVWSLVVQVLVAAGVGTAALLWASRWRPRLVFSRSHALDLWRFGVSVLGIELTGLVNQHADRLILGSIAGPTALGYYFVGLRVVSIAVDSLTAVMATVSLPTFSRLQTDLERLRRAFLASTRISAALCIPVFAALAVLAPVVIPLLFGDQWDRSVPVMQIFCALAVLNSVAYFDRTLLLALGWERWALGLTAGQAVLNVVIAIFTAPHGIIAVALGVAIRQYAFWPVRLWVLRRAIRLDLGAYFRPWITALLASLGMAVVMLLVAAGLADAPPAVELVASGAVGLLVYAGLMRLIAPARLVELAGLVPRRVKADAGAP